MNNQKVILGYPNALFYHYSHNLAIGYQKKQINTLGCEVSCKAETAGSFPRRGGIRMTHCVYVTKWVIFSYSFLVSLLLFCVSYFLLPYVE
jgi:hypothetical protein